ncbi:hypothetical protein CKALI_01325 [Corynebacterium kalinowskii]|uniref:DUF4233 domain-containing protein n=1 Tax=Corynebacterium kalinowskii TaxID=2675216 RepID=A0A6B8VHU3_9CORY|nr:hypothetical protein [Corynebacterium kalinowskii]QGU01164.1 hypothetical protein CKALI_01325 [Corynebacterium kalinowskii]
MPKFVFFLCEAALLATVPAAYAFDVDMVALVARVLCVALLAASFWLSTKDDRFFAFGFLQALVFGAVWSAQVFGVLPLPILWAMYAVFALEIMLRLMAHRVDWQVRLPGEYVAPHNHRQLTHN